MTKAQLIGNADAAEWILTATAEEIEQCFAPGQEGPDSCLRP